MPDKDPLSQRLDAAFSQAEQKIASFQQQAQTSYEATQQRYQRFVALAQRVGAEIFRPRIEQLKARFPNVEESVVRGRHGANGTLSFKKTPGCLASVTLTFSMAHDATMENVILEYDLEILPIFIKYERNSRLEFPLDQASDEQIARWLDDRIVAFAETYLSLQFTEQYQRDNMVTDPVAETRFPKTFAKGTLQHAGNTYYFVSEETLATFQQDPTRYVGR